MDLGRLIAAERNALTAIELCKSALGQMGDLQAELVKQGQQSAIQQTQIGTLQQRLALMQGTGPTQR